MSMISGTARLRRVMPGGSVCGLPSSTMLKLSRGQGPQVLDVGGHAVGVLQNLVDQGQGFAGVVEIGAVLNEGPSDDLQDVARGKQCLVNQCRTGRFACVRRCSGF